MEINIHVYVTDKRAHATVFYIVPIIRGNRVSEKRRIFGAYCFRRMTGRKTIIEMNLGGRVGDEWV